MNLGRKSVLSLYECKALKAKFISGLSCTTLHLIDSMCLDTVETRDVSRLEERYPI